VFTLLDLPSQAVAVQTLLRGKSTEEKLAWLAAHGTITPKQKLSDTERQAYFFRSTLGSECVFFIDGDEFVFIGHHTTYTVRE
jgi:hypothetical protein